MFSFRRLALFLALGLPAVTPVLSQDSSSSSNSAPGQAQATAPTQPEGQSQAQLSVQARIRARRAQRRVAAIHEIYDHRYEGYFGAGYLRFTPGSTLQRVNEYNWNVGFTRYRDERLGITLDGRGIYGTPFIEPKAYNQGITKPAIAEYTAMIGPTYRFYLQPKFSVSGRVMGGFAYGNFSADTGGRTDLATYLGLYKDGSTFAISASIPFEYNLTPAIGIRIAPEYLPTGFGSTIQNNLGFTGSMVYRFGKQ